jgi:hypothetical protein
MSLTMGKNTANDKEFENNFLRIFRYLNLVKNQRIIFATHRKVTNLTTL